MITYGRTSETLVMDNNNWHLEKRIDLSMILSALIIVMGVFFWASGVNSQLASRSVQIESLKKDIQENRNYILRIEERLPQ